MNEWGEYPFDFEEYIEKGLRRIDDLDERRFAKQVLLEGLGKAIKCMEKKYGDLERRIYEEIEIVQNQYEIVMTVADRDCYDPTNDTLFPVCRDDLDGTQAPQGFSDGELWLGTVFLEMGGEQTAKLRKRAPFLGTVSLKSGERSMPFFIKRADRYRTAMEQLYQTFQDNQILWKTVNVSYLNKFYDVYIKKSDFDAEGRDASRPILLSDCDIYFGEYEAGVKYGVIPLWNIEEITFKNESFMVPCVDGVYYEHEFVPEEKTLSDGYLIQNNQDIVEIRQEEGKIIIKSPKENYENWKAFHLIQKETAHSLNYDAPLLTNHRKDSFVRRYSEKNQTRLLTKADLFRRVTELDIQDFIEVVDYEISGETKNYPLTEGMNWFVNDEAFPMDSRKVLVFRFKARNPGHYLNDGMVNFVISQMQLEINEYRLVGVSV